MHVSRRPVRLAAAISSILATPAVVSGFALGIALLASPMAVAQEATTQMVGMIVGPGAKPIAGATVYRAARAVGHDGCLDDQRRGPLQPVRPACRRSLSRERAGTKWKYTPWLPTCPVHLKPEVPVEPIVIRAAAGDCINVTLRNKTLEQAVTKAGKWPIYNDLGKPVFLDLGDKSKGLWADTNADGKGDKAVTRDEVAFDSMPDLAVPNPLPAMVRLNRDDPQAMTSVQSNLLTPSPFVGLHPALVEYDVTRSDGTEVGQNNGLRSQTAGPGRPPPGTRRTRHRS